MRPFKVRSMFAGALIALSLSLLTSRDASAAITLHLGSAPNTFDLKNINLVDATGVTTVVGATQQTVGGSPVQVTFFSNPQINLDASNGQALIQASAPSTAPMKNLTMQFANGFGATVVEFGLQPDAAGDVTVSGVRAIDSQAYSETFVDVKANALGRYYALADNGDIITTVTWSSAVNVNMAKQYRVDGVQAVVPTPEPGTLGMALTGVALSAGCAMRRRRSA